MSDPALFLSLPCDGEVIITPYDNVVPPRIAIFISDGTWSSDVMLTLEQCMEIRNYLDYEIDRLSGRA